MGYKCGDGNRHGFLSAKHTMWGVTHPAIQLKFCLFVNRFPEYPFLLMCSGQVQLQEIWPMLPHVFEREIREGGFGWERWCLSCMSKIRLFHGSSPRLTVILEQAKFDPDNPLDFFNIINMAFLFMNLCAEKSNWIMRCCYHHNNYNSVHMYINYLIIKSNVYYEAFEHHVWCLFPTA